MEIFLTSFLLDMNGCEMFLEKNYFGPSTL